MRAMQQAISDGVLDKAESKAYLFQTSESVISASLELEHGMNRR